jgi:hypothetical protein
MQVGYQYLNIEVLVGLAFQKALCCMELQRGDKIHLLDLDCYD